MSKANNTNAESSGQKGKTRKNRGRRCEVTEVQLEALVTFMEEPRRKLFARGSFGKGLFTKKASERYWLELTNLLNSLEGPNKSTAQWSKFYSQTKTNLKKKVRKINESYNKTGGGTGSQEELTPLEGRLQAILGTVFATKLPDVTIDPGLDSDNDTNSGEDERREHLNISSNNNSDDDSVAIDLSQIYTDSLSIDIEGDYYLRSSTPPAAVTEDQTYASEEPVLEERDELHEVAAPTDLQGHQTHSHSEAEAGPSGIRRSQTDPNVEAGGSGLQRHQTRTHSVAGPSGIRRGQTDPNVEAGPSGLHGHQTHSHGEAGPSNLQRPPTMSDFEMAESADANRTTNVSPLSTPRQIGNRRRRTENQIEAEPSSLRSRTNSPSSEVQNTAERATGAPRGRGVRRPTIGPIRNQRRTVPPSLAILESSRAAVRELERSRMENERARIDNERQNGMALHQVLTMLQQQNDRHHNQMMEILNVMNHTHEEIIVMVSRLVAALARNRNEEINEENPADEVD